MILHLPRGGKPPPGLWRHHLTLRGITESKVRPRLPHVTGLGGVDRVTLRPELRVGQGLRLRRLRRLTNLPGGPLPGVEAGACGGEWGEARKGKSRGSPDLRVECVSEARARSEEAVCPALWLGCSAPTPFRARALPPRCAPLFPRAIPGGVRSRRGQLYAPCPAARHRAFPGRGRRLAAGKSLFGRGGSAFIWARPGRGGASRRALRAGRGRGRALPESRRAALGLLEGPLLSRGPWGSRTSGSVECQGLERPEDPVHSLPSHLTTDRGNGRQGSGKFSYSCQTMLVLSDTMLLRVARNPLY